LKTQIMKARLKFR